MLTIRNPRVFAGLILCACISSFTLGLALPLPSARVSLVDTQTGSVISRSISHQTCLAMLGDYPVTAPRACL